MWPMFYYTVSRKELRSSEMPATLPLLLSAASFVSQKKDGSCHLVPPRQPLPKGPKGADCGGFPATLKGGARYCFQPKQYIQWLSSWNPQWAATFDLCCFDPHTVQGRLRLVYPRAEIVKERQQFTTRMAETFWIRARTTPWAWCPSIQGFTPQEYEAHARQLAPLIRTMFAYYSDPGWIEEDDSECPFRVGIGSLCGRARLPLLLEIIERVQGAIGDDIPLHLWGVKLKTLKAGVALPGVISIDTGAWSNLFCYKHEKRRASGLTEIEYSWRVSYPDYNQRIRAALQTPQQIPLLHTYEHPWRYVHHHKIADALANEEDTQFVSQHQGSDPYGNLRVFRR